MKLNILRPLLVDHSNQKSCVLYMFPLPQFTWTRPRCQSNPCYCDQVSHHQLPKLTPELSLRNKSPTRRTLEDRLWLINNCVFSPPPSANHHPLYHKKDSPSVPVLSSKPKCYLIESQFNPKLWSPNHLPKQELEIEKFTMKVAKLVVNSAIVILTTNRRLLPVYSDQNPPNNFTSVWRQTAN